MSVNSTVAMTRSGSVRGPRPRQELLDLREDSIDVLREGEMIAAWKLHVSRIRYEGCDPAAEVRGTMRFPLRLRTIVGTGIVDNTSRTSDSIDWR